MGVRFRPRGRHVLNGNGEAALAFLNGCQHDAFESGGGDASELEAKAHDSEEEDN